MRASFVFSEVVTGLRRNVTMTIAMIITTAISLTLLGSGMLVVRMIDNTQELYQDKLQVHIFLTNDVGDKDKTCTQDPCKRLKAELESNTDVIDEVVFESREQAYERFRRIFEGQPELVQVARPEALPASLQVKLKNPDRPEVIAQTYATQPGVDKVVDQSDFLDKFFDALGGIQALAFVAAIVQAIAALLLISNTVQVSAYTRRTEVGIMRLVGATRWYTQLPFLLEAVVAGVIGAIAAIGLLVGVKSWFFDEVIGNGKLIDPNIISPIRGVDVVAVTPWLVLTAILISAVTGYVTLRLYVRR
ncbi:cell division transport system permease protein [Herbihabitans rhizosphaerae]|uniref:Cell division protein FtsX n=1 Tax=Herbihabitans rhizosphaerae TaxID=1872711 RepID=A0A4Q7KDU4_9PSEU|nr:permease-like cell division protein FtsX [Herbihabitans rhizosphaerae]RZS32211.1 cell division transport system permease protein [Herbihabitans rhizosphaerae]